VTINEVFQLITAIAAAVAGIGSVWNNIQIGKTHSKVAELETNTNSIKDALIASTHKEAFQAGQIDQASQIDPGRVNAVVSPIRERVDKLELEISQTRALSARRGQELIDLRAAQRQLEDEVAKLRARMP
jgi:hypothetical protein